MSRRRYTDEQLREAVAGSRFVSEALRKLGVVGRGEISEEDFMTTVARSRSVADALRRLGLPVTSGTRDQFRRMQSRLDPDISHFTGPAWNKGMKYAARHRKPLARLLVEGHLHQSSDLKERLFQEGVKDRRCELCGLKRWQRKPLVLELDHINGVRDDNRLENLRIACPNCHSQTENFRGRNIGRATAVRQLRML